MHCMWHKIIVTRFTFCSENSLGFPTRHGFVYFLIYVINCFFQKQIEIRARSIKAHNNKLQVTFAYVDISGLFNADKQTWFLIGPPR